MSETIENVTVVEPLIEVPNEGPPAKSVKEVVASLKPKAEASRKILESLSVVQKTRQEQLAVKSDREKFQAELNEAKELRALKVKIEEAKTRGDIGEVLKLQGFSPEATAAYLATGARPPATSVEKELTEVKNKLKTLDEEKAAATEAAKGKQTEEAIKSVADLVNNDAEAFPLTAFLKQGDTVAKMMVEEANKTGKVPDLEKVQAEAEKYYMGMVEGILDNPKGLDFLAALVDKKRGIAKKAEAKERKEPTITPPEKDVRTLRFGGYRTALDQALAEATEEVSKRK